MARSHWTEPPAAGRQIAPTWDPVEWSAAYWTCCVRSAEIWWTRRAGRRAIAERMRDRFRAVVRLAHDRSPFYRSLYRELDLDEGSTSAVPVVTKRQLMEHFDDWVTDRAIRLSDVEAFLADRRHIGERFLGRYAVWKSSGSSGVPGIFLQDDEAMAVYDALMLAQLDVSSFGPGYASRMVAGNARAALVVATDDHFASIAAWHRAQRMNPALQARSFSVLRPIGDLVRELGAYQPAFVASYPTVLCLLAAEQRAGRLLIAPARLWSGGECLAPGAHKAIEEAFGCPLTNEYGASECLSIAYECEQGWMHVNADWVLLEAVDEERRPVAPGVPSHTTLLTNLVNTVQPIIRFDLGDSIIVNPEPCRCGNPLPSMRVQGRRDEVLSLQTPQGRTVQLLPMALTTVIEQATELHRFQLVQTDAGTLALRFDHDANEADRARAWHAAASALRAYLRANDLPNVAVVLDALAPQLQSPGGKLRVVSCTATCTRH